MIREKSFVVAAALLAGCTSTSVSQDPSRVYAVFDAATGRTYNVPMRRNLLAGIPAPLASTSATASELTLSSSVSREQGAPIATLASAAPLPLGVISSSVAAQPEVSAEPTIAIHRKTATSTRPRGNPSPSAPLALKMDKEFASAKRLIRFAAGLAALGRIGKLALAELIPWAKQSEKVYVRGGADASGDVRRNRELAMARAATVKSALVSGGVPPDKIDKSFCADCYVASNATDAGRRINRRVEIELVLENKLYTQMPKPSYALEVPAGVRLLAVTSFQPKYR
jgi:outer membrane protein OmpA-like peptidoglycan-associated protein